jgi:hypothetical protein
MSPVSTLFDPKRDSGMDNYRTPLKPSNESLPAAKPQRKAYLYPLHRVSTCQTTPAAPEIINLQPCADRDPSKLTDSLIRAESRSPLASLGN